MVTTPGMEDCRRNKPSGPAVQIQNRLDCAGVMRLSHNKCASQSRQPTGFQNSGGQDAMALVESVSVVLRVPTNATYVEYKPLRPRHAPVYRVETIVVLSFSSRDASTM